MENSEIIKNYRPCALTKFIKEAVRILKPKGKLLITGHLDVPTSNKATKLWRQFSIFSPSFLEFITRRWHQFRNRVALDDHTVHFENTAILEKDLTQNGLRIVQSEVVGTDLFFILAEKEM